MDLDRKLVSYRYRGELIIGTIVKYSDYHYLLYNNNSPLSNGGLIKHAVFKEEWNNVYEYYLHIKDLENIEIAPGVYEVWN